MIRNILATAAATAMVAAPVRAQSIDPFAPSGYRPDARATVGIIVPLGGRRGDVASRPRAELRLGPDVDPVSLSDRRTLRAIGIRSGDTVAPRPGAVAVTLGGNPRWMLAGHILGADQDESPEDDDGIDTLEGIGIGVGVLLVLTVAAATTLVISLDCGDEEECN